jgi:DNA-binding CsgD family transcriptional regulator
VIPDTIRSASTRVARIGLAAADHLDAQREALSLVRQIIPFDVGTFATVDPATVLWTSCVLHGIEPNPSREALMFDNEYRQDDLLKVSELARKPEPAGRLSRFDAQTLSTSPRYQVIRGYGAVDELRCAMVDKGKCWGSFEIYRAGDTGPFTEEDERNAAMLSKPLARLIRIALLKQAAAVPASIDEPPGVVVLDARGEVEAMSPSCRPWLDDISANESVPATIRSLAIRAASENQGTLSIAVPRRSGGWLRVHAIPLRAESKETVSIIIEPARPAVIPDTVASVYGFTPRECDVITWMARGLSSKEIASHLGISTFTVNDHIKAVFQKTGVQSRQQLVAALFFDHCLPLREIDAVPGPYGWFLDDDRLERNVPA